MLKQCLDEIANNKLDLGDKRKAKLKEYVDRYSEEELYYLLSSANGIIADDIFICYYPGVGFRCGNDISLVGRLPICNTLQRIMNKKYEQLLADIEK